MSGNQEPKSVDLTQAAIDAGSEVCAHLGHHGGLRQQPRTLAWWRARAGRHVACGGRLALALERSQELSRRVTVAMKDAHAKSVAVSAGCGSTWPAMAKSVAQRRTDPPF